MTKDEFRVQRSISSIIHKIENSLKRNEPKRYRDWLESEREFEQNCIQNNIIYSPQKFIDLCK